MNSIVQAEHDHEHGVETRCQLCDVPELLVRFIYELSTRGLQATLFSLHP